MVVTDPGTGGGYFYRNVHRISAYDQDRDATAVGGYHRVYGQRPPVALGRREWLVGVGGLVSVATLALLAIDGSPSKLQRPLPINVDPGLTSFRDFTVRNSGLRLPAGGYVGAGVDKTVLRMIPGSSTRAARVNALPIGSTNPYYLLQTPRGGAMKLAGFTLQGTHQGHPYGGIMLDHQNGHTLTDLTVRGVPGTYHAPPGETFAINDWGGHGGVLERVEVDGQGVTAAGIATNSSTEITLNDCYVHDCPYSSPTHWQTVGITVNNFRSVRNLFGYNHERCSGTIRYDGLHIELPHTHTAGMHLTFQNDQQDADDIELFNVSWTATGTPTSVAGGALCVMISDGYAAVHNPNGSTTYMQKQTTLPRIHNTAGALLQWADAGTSGDPANGLPAVPRTNVAAAKADPKNWAVRFH